MTRLVACQMVSSADVDENLATLEQQLAEIKSEQPTLVVLPECFACFGGSDKQLLQIAEAKNNGKLQSRLSSIAKANRVWLATGTIPLLCDDPQKFTASCLLIDDLGEVQAEYQKIHLFDVQVNDNTKVYKESLYTQAGNQIVTLQTPLGKIGMAVCYDIRFAGLFNAMDDVDILILPSAFTEKTGKAHWHNLLAARAIEKQCYLVAANQGGVHGNGRQTYGHSCIMSPWGEKLAEIEKGSGWISAQLDMQLIENIRKSMPIAQHNKFRSHLV